MSFLSLVLDGGRRTLRQIALVCKALSRHRLAGADASLGGLGWIAFVGRVRRAALQCRIDQGEISSQSRNAILFAAGLM
ncbi:hypothetical protein BSN85_09570 [Bradyrhizobium brasilense]|nr:hypothetical protein BSN85_09570 [Bradyrhizobium brasilense]